MKRDEQPFLQLGDEPWINVWDGNSTAAALYDRHYSRSPRAIGDPRVAGGALAGQAVEDQAA